MTCENCHNEMPPWAVSLYFCGDWCQTDWHARRSLRLTEDYLETDSGFIFRRQIRSRNDA